MKQSLAFRLTLNVIRAHTETVVAVQTVDARHIPIGQREIEHPAVLDDAPSEWLPIGWSPTWLTIGLTRQDDIKSSR